MKNIITALLLTLTLGCLAQTNTGIILIDVTTPQVVSGRSIVGDTLLVAGNKANGNFLWLGLQVTNLNTFIQSLSNYTYTINPMTTNFAPGNGYVPMSSNSVTGGIFWVPIGSIGGGGGGTNGFFIAQTNGTGLNAQLFGTNIVSGITFGSSAIGPQTNMVTVVTSPRSYPFDGDYTWNNGATIMGVSGWFTNIVACSTNFAARGYTTNYVGHNGVVNPDADALFTYPDYGGVSLIGLYTNINSGVSGPVVWSNYFANVFYTHSASGSTNSTVTMNGIGPNGAQLIFPFTSGNVVVKGASQTDAQGTGDYGISAGRDMGQILGEAGTTQFGTSNDVAGIVSGVISGATISGGTQNTVGNLHGLGNYSTISGGVSNVVAADYATAIGSQCAITHNGDVMLNDHSAGVLSSVTNNQLVAHFSGGYNFNGIQMFPHSSGTNVWWSTVP